MKKFTMNFLSGEYRSLLHILRSVALGLVALLLAHTSAFSQCIGPNTTVTFKAGELNSCFLDDDSVYAVQISAANFFNLDSINLFLNYDETGWVFDGYSILEGDVFNRTDNGNVPLSIDDNGSRLNIHWTEVDVRGWLDNTGAYVPFLELRFRTTGNPGSYTNSLAWMSTSKIFVCGGSNPALPYVEWTNVAYLDGAITTTVAYPAIAYTVDPAQPVCATDPVNITVTDPVGADLLYSFNGLTWTNNPVANSTAGNNTVQVMNGVTGCVSIVKNIVIDAPDELEWDVDITDESCDRQGEIQFEITTPSTGPYVYWVVPDFDMSDVMYELWYGAGENAPSLAKYKTTTNQVLRPEGYYYLMVQDANGCVNLQTAYWWEVYIDGSSVVDATIDATVEDVSCAGGSDGEITISSVSGGEVGSAGYEVWVDGVLDGYYTSGNYVISGLSPDTYTIEVKDTVDCTYSDDITINDVDPWSFEVEYLDAPCAAATGELWIAYILDGEGDTIDMSTLGTDVTFHVVGGTPEMPIDTTILATETLVDIPAANYKAWIQDTATGCAAVAYDNSDNSGNTIPILDDGSITYKVTPTDETCYGEEDGTIEVYDVTRTCESCNDGAVYEYMVMDTAGVSFTSAWIGIDSVIDGLAPDVYWVIVRDAAKTESVCAVSDIVEIEGASAPLSMVIDSAYAPTCHGGNDGYVKMYVYGGTPPYQYSVDNAPNWRDNPPFGLTEGEHLLQVRDANMCVIDSVITVDSIDAIIIDATIGTIACPGEGAQVSVTFSSYSTYADPDDYDYYYSADSLAVFAGTTFFPDSTELQPGKWYVGAMDPNGCVSNIVGVELDPVEELDVEFSYEDAMCYGTWTGLINMEVTSGFADSTFMYTFANTSQALQKPDSLLNWYYFNVDSVKESVEMRKGGYWFVVKGACDQYIYSEYIVIDGFDPINVDPIDSIIPVSCNGGSNGGFVVTDEVSGGAPGYGIEGAKYLYTLYDADDDVVGDELQESGAYTTLSAGTYMLYVYDNTDLTVDPTMCLPDSISVTIPEYPELVIDSINTYAVSCAGENNGEIHVFISGGLGGISTLTGDNALAQPDGKAYTVTVNDITGDQGYSLKLGDAIDTVVFQTQGGDFEVVVKDANGCVKKDTVTVMEPLPFMITEMITEPSDCGENDGVIKGIVVGGFEDLPIQVAVNDSTFPELYYSGDTVTLVANAEYLINYTVTVTNDSMSVVDSGIVVVDDQCEYSESYVIEVINPFDFDTETECTKCYGTSSGTIKISNIVGGSGAYQFQIVSSVADDYDPTDETRWWPKVKNSSGVWVNQYVTDSVVFDTMAAGEYKIYLRDDEDFTLAKCCRPHRVTVCQTDSLELVSVDLVSGVLCAGDSTGAISITATGGTAPYKYAYTRTELGENGYPYVGLPDPDSLTWFDTDTITGLPVGTYIGWVMDANECMVGCEINSSGLPVDRHRVVIMDEGAISVDSIYVEEPMCYGGGATINLYDVEAGVTSTYVTFVLEGVTYLGDTVTYEFDSIANTEASMAHVELEDVVAPMDSTLYTLSIKTDANCESTGISVGFGQPEVYAVSMDVVGDGICVGEQQAVVILSTVGGTAPFSYTLYADGVKYAGPTTNVNHVVPIGPKYTVISTDALGCQAVDTLDLVTPEEVTFLIEDATCYSDSMASIRVTAEGTPNRMFKLYWKGFDGTTVFNTGSSDWFDGNEPEYIGQQFTYDDKSINDIHYEFYVKDDQNCVSTIDTITFDKVDGPLQVVNRTDTVGECSTTFSFEIAGGTSPYMVMVDTAVVADSIGFYERITVSLAGGDHSVFVLDANGCELEYNFQLEYGTTIYDTVVIYEGDTAHYTSNGLDTMLVGGDYEFKLTEEGTDCATGLFVNVTELEKIAPVLLGKTPTDTIETNHPENGFVLTFSTGVSLGDGGNLYVIAPDSTVTLTIPLTAEMFSDSTLTVDYDYTVVGSLDLNTTYTVNVDSAAVMGQGIVWEGLMDGSWTFTTGDSIPTKIDEFETADFKVYPNPFTSYIKIDNYEKLSRVIISNIAGQRVLDIESPTYEIRTGNLVTGVYVVTLIKDNEIVKSERIIKR